MTWAWLSSLTTRSRCGASLASEPASLPNAKRFVCATCNASFVVIQLDADCRNVPKLNLYANSCAAGSFAHDHAAFSCGLTARQPYGTSAREEGSGSRGSDEKPRYSG